MSDSWEDSRPVGELVRAFVAGLGPRDRERMAEAGVATWWAAAIPPEIARHTIGAAMRDGELVVQVDSPMWAAELSAMSEQLRVLIEEASGTGTVRSVRFTVSRRVAMAKKVSITIACAIPTNSAGMTTSTSPPSCPMPVRKLPAASPSTFAARPV